MTKVSKEEKKDRALDGMKRAYAAFDAENKAGAMAKWILSDGALRNAQVKMLVVVYENGVELKLDGREHLSFLKLMKKIKAKP